MTVSTALMTTWMRRQLICARCKTPVEDVATRGGWNPHLCPDKLRSRAFDQFLNWVADIEGYLHALQPFHIEHAANRTVHLYHRMPPWERPIALRILAHAGIEL